MKSFILAACILGVAFAAPHLRRKGPNQDDLKKAGEGIVLGLNAVCEGFGNLVEAYQELEDAEDKRSWETVLEGLKAVCDDLGDAKMGALDANQNGEIEEDELDDASAILMKSLAELCKAMEDLSKLYNGDKRSWDDVFMGLGGVCVDLKTTIMAEIGEKRQNGDKPKLSKEELEELIAECEALKNGDKRDDDPSLEEVCMALAKNKEKGPKPTEVSKRGKGQRPPKTDEYGNTLPPPSKDDMPTKEEVEEMIALCEALKDDKKRDDDLDDADLEDVCRELAKMLKKGPKPTEASKRGKGPRPPKTDADGNTLPPPSKDDMPTKEEVEELIALCETLADDEKRDDDFDEDDLEEVCRELAKMLKKGPKPTESSKRDDMPTKEEVEELIALCEAFADDEKRDDDFDEDDLEEVCRELAKMLKKGPKPTEPSKRGRKGSRFPKTDADGNTLAPPSKDDMPTKEEVEELIAFCEALADDEKRDDDFDEDDLEEVCRELAKMLKKGPKPTESSKRGKSGPRPPKTDADGNTLSPPSKDDMPTKEEVEELIALCEALADDEKRDDDFDEDDLEEVCRELAKMLEKRPPKTDEE